MKKKKFEFNIWQHLMTIRTIELKLIDVDDVHLFVTLFVTLVLCKVLKFKFVTQYFE